MIYMHSNIEQQQNNTENLLCLITESCHIGPHKLGAGVAGITALSPGRGNTDLYMLVGSIRCSPIQ